MQLVSFNSQIEHYKDFINKNDNWTLYKIYSDYGISGRSLKNRKQFCEMIQDALNGNIDLIITKSISRFGRNVNDTLQLVRKLKDNDIAVYFEEEGIYTIFMETEFLLSVLASVAEHESKKMSERVIKGREMLRKQGYNVTTGKDTFGYSSNKINGYRIVKSEAMVIQYIFELFDKNYNYNQISKILMNEGIKNTANKKNWYGITVRNIILNDIYLGNENYPQIISNDLYERTRNKLPKIKARESKKTINIPVMCGICGSRTKSSVCYLGVIYRCKNPKCVSNNYEYIYLKEYKLYKFFKEFLHNLITSNKLEKLNKERIKQFAIRKTLNQKIELINNQISNSINSLFYNGFFEEDKINKLRQKEYELNIQLDEIENKVNELDFKIKYFNEIFEKIEDNKSIEEIFEYFIWGERFTQKLLNINTLRFIYKPNHLIFYNFNDYRDEIATIRNDDLFPYKTIYESNYEFKDYEIKVTIEIIKK